MEHKPPNPSPHATCPLCGGHEKAFALFDKEKELADFRALLDTYPADVRDSIVTMLAKDHKKCEHPPKANVL